MALREYQSGHTMIADKTVPVVPSIQHYHSLPVLSPALALYSFANRPPPLIAECPYIVFSIWQMRGQPNPSL